jgi:hypothetical protein
VSTPGEAPADSQLASAKHALERLASDRPVRAQHEDFYRDEFAARTRYARQALQSLPYVALPAPSGQETYTFTRAQLEDALALLDIRVPVSGREVPGTVDAQSMASAVIAALARVQGRARP